MTFLAYPRSLEKLGNGELDLTTDDVRAILLMTGTDALSNYDAEFVDDLDAGVPLRFDGVGYADTALTGRASSFSSSSTQLWATWTAAPFTLASLQPGTDQIVAVAYVKWVTNDSDSLLLSVTDEGGFPKDATGQDYEVDPSLGFYRIGSRPVLTL